ncbi:MAG: helix-turn-helix transcriptional regulator [Crocinitomicaceae bacterium]|nr:helix-turn-helix transcriptional regulator [Crocinitomicaceae bacterium]
MDISNCIQELIRKNQLNAAKFADRIGVQRSNLSHVLTGRNKPGLDFIEKVLREFPDIDANWLISGNKQSRMELNPSVTNENLSEKPKETGVVSDKREDQPKNRMIHFDKATAKVDKIIVFYSDNSFEEFKK